MVTKITCGKLILGRGETFAAATTNFLTAALEHNDALTNRIRKKAGIEAGRSARLVLATAIIGATGYAYGQSRRRTPIIVRRALQKSIWGSETFTWTLFNPKYGAPAARIDSRYSGRFTEYCLEDYVVCDLFSEELILGLVQFAASRRLMSLRGNRQKRSLLYFPGTQRDWQKLRLKLIS